MAINMKIVLVGALILCALPVTSNAGVFCYSAYHLQQQLDLTVKFGDSVNHQKSAVDVTIHVREISVYEKDLAIIQGDNGDTTHARAFIFLVRTDMEGASAVESGLAQRYQHPFIVLMNAQSGELLDLKSTVKDPAVMKEYLSFFDLFQYSLVDGEYLYRNGNGPYQAAIRHTGGSPDELIRHNSGYMAAVKESDNSTQVFEGELTISLEKISDDCFYQQGKGVEHFKKTLSNNAFVEGDTVFRIETDASKKLPASHFFYTLNNQFAHWPSFEVIRTVSKEEAFSKLPQLLFQLSELVTDDESFLAAMLLEKESWPYLADYILQNEISDDLSIELFWALDKINSTESANALAILATSPLQERDLFRAVMALASTTAPFDQANLDRIKSHLDNYTSTQFPETEGLLYIRLIGAFAKQRNMTAPLQSRELKRFLYSQVGNGFEESVQSAVIDAIGNLGSSIDAEGEQLLFQGLTQGSRKIRNSAAAAFSRVPYDPAYSDLFIDQINRESDTSIKSSLIEVLGQTDNTDLEVKQQLLSILEESNNSKINNKSLSSLKKIEYDLQEVEIKILESKLRLETNKANQRLLASLILKHRQQERN